MRLAFPPLLRMGLSTGFLFTVWYPYSVSFFPVTFFCNFFLVTFFLLCPFYLDSHPLVPLKEREYSHYLFILACKRNETRPFQWHKHNQCVKSKKASVQLAYLCRFMTNQSILLRVISMFNYWFLDHHIHWYILFESRNLDMKLQTFH